MPTDAQVQTAQDELATAEADVDNAAVIWKQKIQVRDQKEATWDTVITARANNCEAVTPNDAAALASTGFPLRSSGAPIGALPAPSNLRATATDNEAEIELRCNTVKGASSYEWECRLHEGKPKALKARPARSAKPNSTTPSAARVRTATVWARWKRPLQMIRRRSWIWNTCGGSSTS